VTGAWGETITCEGCLLSTLLTLRGTRSSDSFAFVAFCSDLIISILPSFHHVHHTRYPVLDAIRCFYLSDLLKTVSTIIVLRGTQLTLAVCFAASRSEASKSCRLMTGSCCVYYCPTRLLLRLRTSLEMRTPSRSASFDMCLRKCRSSLYGW
jgi:hypothetical protein